MNPYLNTLLSSTPTFGTELKPAVPVPTPIEPLAPVPHYALAMGMSFLGWGIPAWLAVKWANEKGLTQKQVFQRWGAVGAGIAAVKVYTVRRLDEHLAQNVAPGGFSQRKTV